VLTLVRRDSLARNSVLIMASTVGTSGLGYLFWLLAARQLTQPSVGTATALISAGTVVSMVSNLGIGHMFIQRLPGSESTAWSRIVGSGLLLGSVSTVLAAVAAVAVLPSLAAGFGFLSSLPGRLALVAAAVTLTASTLLDYVFVAGRASHGMLWRNLALAAGKLVVLLMLTGAGMGSWGAVLVAWVVPSVVVTAYTIGSFPLRPRVDRLAAQLGAVGQAFTGHHLINLAQAGPAALLPVLVTARLGTDLNAHFYVAWMTASILFMVSPAVASALYAERVNDSGATLRRAVVVVLVVISVPAVLLFLGGGWILGLFSPAYAAGGQLLLKILVLAAIPDAITNLAVAHWRSLGRFRRCLRLNLLIAATCLTLTWWWLPGSGIEGAGIAWLTGQSAGAVAVAVLAFRSRPSRFEVRP
jgi:O-antigen/teichoic acid export membrane protein